jgi:hypothetical protein
MHECICSRSKRLTAGCSLGFMVRTMYARMDGASKCDSFEPYMLLHQARNVFFVLVNYKLFPSLNCSQISEKKSSFPANHALLQICLWQIESSLLCSSITFPLFWLIIFNHPTKFIVTKHKYKYSKNFRLFTTMIQI